MKYGYLIFMVFIFSNCKNIEAQPNIPQADTSVEKVKEIMSFLANDELKGRNTGTEGYEKAAVFAEKEFETYGVKHYFDTYRDVFVAKGDSTSNVVGVIKGNDPALENQFIILGAHLDHIGTAKPVNEDTIANGANDNAAGSTAVLTLAKYFGEHKNNKRSILFVLFGAEEKGLLGSKHLAKVLKQKNMDLYTMVNFEMIGVPLNNKSYKAYLTGFTKSNMADKINEYSGMELLGYLPKAKQFGLFKRSDNYPFFKEFNVPCQTISTFDFTNYDYYHHVDDEVSEMNFEFMTNLINQCVPALVKLANSSTKEVVLQEK